MCLITKNTKGYVSDRPKTCYKVYMKADDGELVSYYMRAKCGLIEGDEVIAEGYGNIERVGTNSKNGSLGEGFIHALSLEYKLLRVDLGTWLLYRDVLRILGEIVEIGLDRALDNLLRVLDGLCWCEMEIPAGERYWIGIDGDICAKRMIFKKDITPRKKSKLLDMIIKEYNCINDTSKNIEKLESLIETYKEKGE